MPIPKGPCIVVNTDCTIEVYLPLRKHNYLWLLEALNLTLWHPDVEPSEHGGSWHVSRSYFRPLLRAVAMEFGVFTLRFRGPSASSEDLSMQELTSRPHGPLLCEQFFEDAAAG